MKLGLQLETGLLRDMSSSAEPNLPAGTGLLGSIHPDLPVAELKLFPMLGVEFHFLDHRLGWLLMEITIRSGLWLLCDRRRGHFGLFQ